VTKRKPSEFREFIRSRVLWLNCGGGLALVLLVFIVSFSVMKGCTRHGQSTTVPDLVGRTMDEVEPALDDANLRWAVIDTPYNSNKKPSEVINQEPPAGSKVKERRVIYLTVNAESPKMVPFPSLKEGTPSPNVPSIVQTAGFIVDDIRYIPWKHTAFKYAEIDGKRAVPGRKYPKDSKVILYIGNGLGEVTVPVPDLSGKVLSEAEFVLHDMQLTLGFTEYDDDVRSYRDSIDAIIYRQSPSPSEETKLHIGEVVDVWLTSRAAFRERQVDSMRFE
jgi:beta-lactam-binding protein with PASTA domain